MAAITNSTSLPSRLSSPIVIGIAGPAASGKSMLSHSIAQVLERTPISECDSELKLRVTVIAIDSFIVPANEEQDETSMDPENDIQYGRVVAKKRIDWIELEACVRRLKTSDYSHVVIVEGPLIFAVNYPQLQELFDVKIVVDCDDSVTLERRLERNVKQCGMDEQQVRDVHDLLRHSFNPYIRRESSRASSDPEKLITIDFSKDVVERSKQTRNAIVTFVEGCRNKMRANSEVVLQSEREKIIGKERATLREEMKPLQ